MPHLELREAQLFRLLTSLFGRERVVPQMSVHSICEGRLPAGDAQQWPINIQAWSQRAKCLFTIVNDLDEPVLVVEFSASDRSGAIDPLQLEHQRYMPEILGASGIRYIVMEEEEFDEVLDPRSPLDFYRLFQEKVDYE